MKNLIGTDNPMAFWFLIFIVSLIITMGLSILFDYLTYAVAKADYENNVEIKENLEALVTWLEKGNYIFEVID